MDIRMMNVDGTKSKKLLEEPRGTIIAVDYDPVQKQVGDHFTVNADEATMGT